MTHCDPYPDFSRAEKRADAVMHMLGLGFAVIGTIALIIWAAGAAPGGTIAALCVYGAAMILSFAASAFYHMSPWEWARPTLRRIDHAAIFLKIAGTYTPLVALIGSAFAWGVLAVVWILAAGGAVFKLFYWRKPGLLETLAYLLLGWLSVLLVWPLAREIPAAGLVLIGLGGLLYSLGAVIFSREGLPYQNAIWHGFVLAASVCFFAAIALGAHAAT